MQRLKQEKLEFMGLLAVWLQCGHQSSARAQKVVLCYEQDKPEQPASSVDPKLWILNTIQPLHQQKQRYILRQPTLKTFWCSFVHDFEVCSKKLVHFQASEEQFFSFRRKPTVHWHRNFKNAALKGAPWALTYTSCSTQPSNPVLY